MDNRMRSASSAIVLFAFAVGMLFLAACPNPITPTILSKRKDLVNPAVIITSPADGSSYPATVVVNGSVTDTTSDGSSGQVTTLRYSLTPATIPGADVTSALKPDKSFTFQFPTAGFSGTMVLTVTATDWNGNTGSASLTLPNQGAIPSFAAVPANHQVTLSWDPVPVSQSYSLYYTTNGTLPSAQYGTRIDGVQSPLVIPGLTNGSMHVFQLQSHSSQGQDNWSGYARAIPISPQTLAPEVNGQDTGILVSWNQIQATDQFEVWRSAARGGPYTNITGTIQGQSFLDALAVPGQSYFYQVRPALAGVPTSAASAGMLSDLPSSYPYFAVGTYTEASPTLGVAVAGTRAYAAIGNGDLVVYDIANPKNPTRLGSLATGATNGYGSDVAIQGSFAYFADGFGGLKIVDISNPANPVLKGTGTHTGEYMYDVAVSGNYAYVAADSGGMLIFDVSVSTAPVYRSQIGFGSNAQAVAVNGSYAYVAANYNGLKIVNVSNPLLPTLAGSSPIPAGYAMGLAVSGSTVYLACAAGGLRIIDVTTPSLPALIGACDTPGSARAVVLNGTKAIVADDSLGLEVVDLSVPASPTIVGRLDLPGFAKNLALYSSANGPLIVTADDSGGLSIDAAPAAPLLVGTYPSSGSVRYVEVQGTTAYASIQGVGLDILDIATPAIPVFRGRLTSLGLNLQVAVHGNLGFLAAYYDGYYIADISNPSLPQQLKYISTGYGATSTGASGDYAFFTEGSLLRIVDISAPGAASVVATHNMPGNSDGLAVSGTRVFVVNQAYGMQVVDISAPLSPNLLGYWSSGIANAQGIDVAGNYAYVADSAGTLFAVNCTNPSVPLTAGSVVVGGQPLDVKVRGPFAFIAAGSGGLKVVDVRNPASMKLAASIATTNAEGVAVRGRFAFVADNAGGMKVFDLMMGY